jgi:hypothetical protein
VLIPDFIIDTPHCELNLGFAIQDHVLHDLQKAIEIVTVPDLGQLLLCQLLLKLPLLICVGLSTPLFLYVFIPFLVVTLSVICKIRAAMVIIIEVV